MFYDGSTALGSVVIDAEGNASLITSALTAGDHNLSAYYAGDGLNLPSSSPVIVKTITAPSSPSGPLTPPAAKSRPGPARGWFGVRKVARNLRDGSARLAIFPGSPGEAAVGSSAESK
jgi:Bacterial Ig-like domain (group 3)